MSRDAHVHLVAGAKLRLLAVLGSQQVAHRVQELDIRLLWILCEGSNLTIHNAVSDDSLMVLTLRADAPKPSSWHR